MFRTVLLSCVVCVAGVLPVAAQQVLVSPGSVVLSDDERSAQFFVGNTGDVTSFYKLDPAFFMMGEDGRLTEVQPPFPDNNAESLIRFSPRQFELAPGESQFVRMAARLPDSLPPGEYRVHLRVTNLGDALAEPILEETGAGASTAVIKIQVARAVRVLVRHGVSAGRASLSEVRTKNLGGDRLAVMAELSRVGDGSSRGSYRVYTKDRQGRVRDELVSKGILIYSELPRRLVEDTVPRSAVDPGLELCVAYRDEAAVGEAQDERCTRPG